ncbi:hypothetical protein NP493_643g03049 [Ridgeia piscesae]|uniref:Uncharacterized protein n=1 Tax=Ridgeia piscesae TaxID=27915 RepID=A0AAD9NRF6_RIDPI|nr:hypothetical protein NP493_643g03049 [Ridgeia piscesae]
MRALQMAMTNDTRGQSHDMNGARDDIKPSRRSVTINDTMSRFSSVSSKSRTQPSAEQAQRIAKIFSQRFA